MYINRVLFIAIGILISISANGQDEELETCAYCHTVGKNNAPIVTLEMVDQSVHEGADCDECHENVEPEAHEEKPALVNCGNCHEDEAEVYTQHGIPKIGTDPQLPRCADCHGSHNILASDDENAKTHVKNQSETCGDCHENPEVLRNHPYLRKHSVATYQDSVHGSTLKSDEHDPVSCTSCHGNEGSAHKILPTGNPASVINHFSIADTCGNCHKSIKQDYLEGIHGILMLRGKTNSPTCTNCHGEHLILSPTDTRSSVSVSHVAEGTCIPCHESAAMSEKYGLPAGQLVSFIDRYHGLKSKTGGEAVANCSSCHEAHRILSQGDPKSTIHPDNLQKTCGKCHDDISRSLANTPIHEPQNYKVKGWPLVFTVIYYILISVTVIAMILYIVLDFWRHIRNMTKKEQVVRMTAGDIAQHTLLLISFVVLVLTGFALRFSDSWWADSLFGKTGLISERSLIHRTAGVVLILTALMHIVYLSGKKGKEFIKQIFPRISDVNELISMLSYNLGFKKEKPELGRFSYVEKFEYWALIWGVIIMAVTGVILWFDNTFIQLFSPVVLEVVRVIHYYEAWLATLAILIWHLYAVIFNPGVYPMNPSWITGKMPKDQYQHEHPGDLS